jgi:hypothetical protein
MLGTRWAPLKGLSQPGVVVHTVITALGKKRQAISSSRPAWAWQV